MNLWKGYIRWRHSRGYGVHSPYAYRFITDVLKPGIYGYYAYNLLPSLSKGQSIDSGKFYKEAKFLIRLAIFLSIKRIISYGKRLPEAQIAAKALKILYYGCDGHAEVRFKRGDLLIIPENHSLPSIIIEKAIENNVPVFALNPSKELRKILESPIKNGLLFTGQTRILLIPRREMEYVAYSINL